jgi:hypothetical protein
MKTRIAKTSSYLKTLNAKDIDGSADREITFPLGPTNKGDMKGRDYLANFLLPNFYFHIATAYGICAIAVLKSANVIFWDRFHCALAEGRRTKRK